MRKFGFGLVIIIVLVTNLLYAQREVEVTLVGTRIPVTNDQPVRQVEIITSQEIQQLPVHSVPELIRYITGVDVQHRLPYDVQADVSIRGSTFQQTMVLIDGVRVTDPQTAHHNFNLPVTLSDIDRVEILPGHGSSVYGPDAYAGAVNIVTSTPEPKRIKTKFTVAEYGTFTGQLSLSHVWGDKFGQQVSVEQKKSTGFRYDTDFNVNNWLSKTTFNTGDINTALTAGMSDRQFGAYNFYSNITKDERESLQTKFISLTSQVLMGDRIKLVPRLYFRENKDWFYWKFNSIPGENTHTTYVNGGELETHLRIGTSELVLGSELVGETIASTKLGVHTNYRTGLFTEYQFEFPQSIRTNLGMRADYHSDWGWQPAPSLSTIWQVSPVWNWRVSVGRVFRKPSFTELYYRDGGNIGNPQLKPEEALSYELGTEFNGLNKSQLRFNLFDRKETNVIDWVRLTNLVPWEAKNITEIRMFGLETKFSTTFWGTKWNLGYMWTGSIKKDNVYPYSKYTLRYPEHQVTVVNLGKLPGKIEYNINLNYRQRPQEQGYIPVDLRLSRKFWGSEIFFEITNLFDQKYEDIPGILQPGRWLGVGFSWQL